MTQGKQLKTYGFNKVVIYMVIYQFISKAILFVGAIVFRLVSGTLLWSMNRPAFTSGDIPYFLRSWQGWVLIICTLVALFIYVSVDINMAILLSHKLLKREKISFKALVIESFESIKRFISFRGLVVLLYIAVIAPLVGAPFGLSITRNLVVPDFIMSVISSSLVLKILYIVVVLFLLVVGIVNMFVFNFVTIEKQNTREALRSSRYLMKKEWKLVVKEYAIFLAKSIVAFLIIFLFTFVLPSFLLTDNAEMDGLNGFLVIMGSFLFLVGTAIFLFFFLALATLKITEIFGKANGEKDYGYYPIKVGGKKPWVIGVISLVVIVGVVSGALLSDFDEVFPPLNDVKIISHRGGGNLAHENSVNGVNVAYQYGASATETDVQRTKDGEYIINHDDDFSRLCGVEKTSSEMTLSEIKGLKLKYDKDTSVPPTTIPTASEFLDAAKDKLTVYLELKGQTADRQMADDMYKLVKSKGMIDKCVFIGLDYDLIKYIGDTYKDATTGYLCFFSFGEIEDLDFDILMPEMETATNNNVDKINEAGKKADVWTVNTINAMLDFLTSDVDGIITDNVDDAQAIKYFIQSNETYFRIVKAIYD